MVLVTFWFNLSQHFFFVNLVGCKSIRRYAVIIIITICDYPRPFSLCRGSAGSCYLGDDGMRIWVWRESRSRAAAGHHRAGVGCFLWRVARSVQALNSSSVQPQSTLNTTLWQTCVWIQLL